MQSYYFIIVHRGMRSYLSKECADFLQLQKFFKSLNFSFLPIQVLESSHEQSITSVLYNLGMVVTASKDGQVLIHSPGGSHDLLCTLEQRTSAPTGLDFSRNTLAVAGGDRNVSLWTHSVTGSIV